MRAKVNVVSTVLVYLLAVTSQAVDATIAPGDAVSGELQAAESDSLSFFVGSPATLDVAVKLDKELRVDLRVLRPDGTDVALSVRNGASRKPSIRGVPLTRAGAYRLIIAQGTGAGGYRVKMKLGKHKGRAIDLTAAPPGGLPFQLPAAGISFDPTGTGLTGTTVQDAVAEAATASTLASAAASSNAAAIAGVMADNVQQGNAIDAIAADVSQNADDIATASAASSQNSADIVALDGRVAALGTPSALSVLLAEGPSVIPATKELVGSSDTWVIDAASLASLQVEGDELSEVIVVLVSAAYVAEPTSSTALRHADRPQKLAIWATIGGDVTKLQMWFGSDGVGRVDDRETGDGDAAAMGVPTPLRTARQAATFRLVRPLTAAETAAGFTLDLNVGLLGRDRDDLSQTGAHLQVNSVLILGK